ncbi:MAG: ectonucleotide pyrophosphatase/phosphodiesterase [Oscillospiraceae bacterium]|nr:ectonucleotide pyrophosphatase/phosphodiesterase [Oscillospiraceae bacterium]
MSKLLIVSFDALSSAEWEDIQPRFPNIAAFAKSASVTLDARSVFPTNTYPVHCSVATGRPPREHGVLGNTEPFPSLDPRWIVDESAIKAKTIWQAAAEAGLTSAAVLWPCTCGSRYIRWNVPETHIRRGENQILANLRAGGKILQARLMLKYGGLLDGVRQPALDNFVTACAADILRGKRPDLTMVHLTCYDLIRHHNPYGSPELQTAYASLDRSLGILLEAAGKDTAVIVFSDHAQLDVHTIVIPNDILVGMGLMGRGANGFEPGESGCFVECCGGSAFFHAGALNDEDTARVRAAIAGSEGFGRFLTEEETLESGRAQLPFGFSAKLGYCYDNVQSGERGNHGYPADMPDYCVFYAVRGEGFKPGARRGGSLLDVAPIAAGILGIDMFG